MVRQWNASKTRDLPAIDDVHAALEARIPEQGPATIVHGDYRLDNCMVGPDGALRAVFDWELCTLGDPLADVGMLQVYWTGPDDEQARGRATRRRPPASPTAPRCSTATPTRRVAISPTSTSTSTFAFWKLACILEGVYARYVAGAMGELDPSHYDHFRITVERAAAAAAERIGRS